MAKFSQALLQGLLNPAYQGQLTQAAVGLGQTPMLMAQQQQRQQQEKGMMGGMLAAQQAAAEGRFDPETMKSYMGSMQRLGVPAQDIMKTIPTLQETSKTAIKENALADLQTSITELANPETTVERARELRSSALSQGRSARVDEARLSRALDAADKNRVGTFLENETRIINELSLQVKQAISSGQSKETFVARHGEEYGYIYDDELNSQTLKKEQLRVAKESKNLSDFTYTDKELEDLGLTAQQIANVKALKLGGGGKNNAVYQYVKANAATAPNASLINVYAKAFEVEVAKDNNLDFDDADEYKEIQSRSAQKALELFSNQGFQGIVDATVESQSNTDPNTFDYETLIEEITQSLGQPD